MAKVVLTLEAQIKNLEKGLDTVNKKLKGVGDQSNKSTQQVNRNFDSVRQKTQKFAAYFGAAIGGVAVVGAIKKSIDAMKEFEQTFTNVLTLMSAAERKQFGGFMKEGSLNLMRQYGFAIQDVNKALFDSVSAGIKAGESIAFMNAAAKLAIAGVTSLGVAVDGMTSIMNAYGLSTKDAERVSAAFFTGQKYGKTTVEELANNIGKLAPITASAGISFQEMLSAMALLTSVGISTEEATTGLRATITALIAPGTEAQKTFSSLGIETGLVALKQNGLGKTLLQVAKAAKTNEDQLVEMIPNIRALTAITALGEKALIKYEDILKQVNEDYGEGSSMMEAYILQQNTVAIALRRIGGAVKANMVALGETFGPLIRGLANVVAPLEGSRVALERQREELNLAVISTTGLKEGTDEHKIAIQQLINAYPEYFKNLDAENTKNEDLVKTLSSVNDNFAKKILLTEYADELAKVTRAEEKLETKRIAHTKSMILFAERNNLGNLTLEEMRKKYKQIVEDPSWAKFRAGVGQGVIKGLENSLVFWDEYEGKLADIGDERGVIEIAKKKLLELLGFTDEIITPEVPVVGTGLSDILQAELEASLLAVAEFNKSQQWQDFMLGFLGDPDITGQKSPEIAVAKTNADYVAELWAKTYEGRVSMLQTALEKGIIAEQEYNDKIIELDKEVADEKRKNRQDIADVSLSIAGATVDALIALNQSAMARELSAAEGNEKKQEEIRKKYAKKEQTYAILRTLISGAEAIVKTAANLGYPAAIPFQIALALQTLAQLAVIKSQKFATGGYEVLGGKRHSEGGTMTPIGEAERGEGHAIFSRWATDHYGGVLPSLVDSINKGKFPRVDMDISNKIDAGEKLMRFFHKVSLDDSKQLEDIKKLLSVNNEQTSIMTDKKGNSYMVTRGPGYVKKMKIK